jgi:hypothetical protein
MRHPALRLVEMFEGEEMRRFRGRPWTARVILIRTLSFLAIVIICVLMAWLYYTALSAQ